MEQSKYSCFIKQRICPKCDYVFWGVFDQHRDCCPDCGDDYVHYFIGRWIYSYESSGWFGKTTRFIRGFKFKDLDKEIIFKTSRWS